VYRISALRLRRWIALVNMTERSWFSFRWFPARRFDADFPLAVWFAGLWLYLKGFLYVCYVYMEGLEPAAASVQVTVETIYFSLMVVPCVILALGLWNERRWAAAWAIAFFCLDTPLLFFHVMRLYEARFLDSGLTRALEIGSLGLNVAALAWLVGSRTAEAARELRKR
jgi:hypothetical protein